MVDACMLCFAKQTLSRPSLMNSTPATAAQKTCHVAIAADRNFSIATGLACLSLMRVAKPDVSYHFHILGDDIETGVLDTLELLCQEHHCSLSYYDISEAVSKVVSSKTFPRVTYARFLLPKLLPESIDRVWYADADVMFCRDISDLFEMDLGDALLAGVQDIGQFADPDVKQRYVEHCKTYDIPYEGYLGYYAGQLMFNLPQWRGSELVQQIFDMASAPDANFPFKSQDVMNILCAGRIKTIGLEWGIIPYYLYLYNELLHMELPRYFPYSKQEVADAVARPSFLHFAPSRKVFVLFPPFLNRLEGFYKLWRTSPWKKCLPYNHANALNQTGAARLWYVRAMLAMMKLLLYIPKGYEIYWALCHILPRSLWMKLDGLCPTLLRSKK